MEHNQPRLILPKSPVSSISEKQKYRWTIGYCFLLIFSGFLVNTPQEIITGLWTILISPANLLTDYIRIANLGAALVNSGSLTLINTLLAKKLGVKMNGPLTAALYTMCGFSFFGKNLYNSLPILIGVWLYSRWEKKDFANFFIISLFGTSLAPAVSELSFDLDFPVPIGICLGIAVGVLIGFILPTLSVHFLSFHQGFSLYNIGFTAGIIGMLLTGVLRIFHYEVTTVSQVSSGNNLFLATLLYVSYLWLFLIGFFSNKKSLTHLKQIFQSSGKLISDFILLDGYGATMMNMAILGVCTTTYVLLIGGNLSGPVIGGIYTVVGFGAYGAHIKNSFPIILGVYLIVLFTGQNPAETTFLLTALFGTTLAPIAGFYGIIWGIIAGMLHTSLVSNVGFLHGGLNLYNNGFSGGFVAAFMVPILDSLYQRRKELKNARRTSKS